MKDNRDDRATGQPHPRRPYVAPRLVEYGSVAKLTQGTKSNGFDSAGGGHSKNCL
jgi:hypothetical protein